MNDLSNQKLLVIAPHPDDEVLGCGGLIKKVKEAGGKVFVQYLTNGTTRDFSQKGTSTISERRKEIRAVANYLQFDTYHVGFASNAYHLKLDTYGQMAVMQLIERKSPISIEKIKPTTVAFPSQYSYNQDHQLVARAVHAVLRPSEKPNKHFVSHVVAYEVPADAWSLHNQNPPNLLVSLNKKEFTAKTHAMKLYASQMRPWPNPRAIKTLEAFARLRGSLASTDFAEGYFIYRMVA